MARHSSPADERSVGKALEARARRLLRQEDGLPWDASGGSSARRELALLLNELDGLRQEHRALDSALRDRACELGTARFALERLYGRYDPARLGAGERVREQQARVDSLREEARRSHTASVRRAHRELLRLLHEHAVLEGR